MKRILHLISAVLFKSLGNKITNSSNLSLGTADHFCQWVKLLTCRIYNGHLYPSFLALEAMGCVLAAQNESLLSNSSQLGGGRRCEKLIEMKPEQASDTYVN